MIRRFFRGIWALLRKPTFWGCAAVTTVPLVLSFLPGLPTHGYGLFFWLPLLAWFFVFRKRQRPRLALYALAYFLQMLAFPDPDFGFLGWVLLVPYLVAREKDDGASWWRTAFFFGFFRAVTGFYWLGEVHYTAWMGVSLLAGLVFLFCFELPVRRLTTVPFSLRVGAAWLLFEAVHGWLFTGFPWLYLSHTQYRYLPVIQIADLFGAFGISFLMALVQAAAFQAIRQRRLTTEAIIATVLVAATVVYGAIRLARVDPPDGPGILMIQTNVPHSVKVGLLQSRPGDMWKSHLLQTREGLKRYPDASLVVWPETMVPFPYLASNPRRGAFLPNARRLAREFKRPVLYGINSYASPDRLRRSYNSALVCDAEGNVRGDLYRKQRLVPMGEEFAGRWFLDEETADRWFVWLSKNFGIPRSCDLVAGEDHVTLDGGEGLRCAMLICFEGFYPDLARGAVRKDDPDLILLLVNNGWFGDTYQQRQLRSICVFRAVETRTPLFVCANTGVTCAIDASGDIFAQFDRVREPGVLYARVPDRRGEPFFMGGGAFLLPFLVGGAVLLAWLRGRLSGPGNAR